MPLTMIVASASCLKTPALLLPSIAAPWVSIRCYYLGIEDIGAHLLSQLAFRSAARCVYILAGSNDLPCMDPSLQDWSDNSNDSSRYSSPIRFQITGPAETTSCSYPRPRPNYRSVWTGSSPRGFSGPPDSPRCWVGCKIHLSGDPLRRRNLVSYPSTQARFAARSLSGFRL